MTTLVGQVWAGPYVDRPVAVLMVGEHGDIGHLTPDQCRQLAQLLTAAASPKNRTESP